MYKSTGTVSWSIIRNAGGRYASSCEHEACRDKRNSRKSVREPGEKGAVAHGTGRISTISCNNHIGCGISNHSFWFWSTKCSLWGRDNSSEECAKVWLQTSQGRAKQGALVAERQALGKWHRRGPGKCRGDLVLQAAAQNTSPWVKVSGSWLQWKYYSTICAFH